MSIKYTTKVTYYSLTVCADCSNHGFLCATWTFHNNFVSFTLFDL